jgi:hypothetical protein
MGKQGGKKLKADGKKADGKKATNKKRTSAVRPSGGATRVSGAGAGVDGRRGARHAEAAQPPKLLLRRTQLMERCARNTLSIPCHCSVSVVVSII